MSDQSKLAKQRSEIARLTQALEAKTAEVLRLRGMLAAVLKGRPGADREAAEELAWGRNREWVE